MVANGSPGYLTVHQDGTVTVLGSPAPATSPAPPAPLTTKPAAKPTNQPASAGKPSGKPTPTKNPTVPPTSTAPLPGGAR